MTRLLCYCLLYHEGCKVKCMRVCSASRKSFLYFKREIPLAAVFGDFQVALAKRQSRYPGTRTGTLGYSEKTSGHAAKANNLQVSTCQAARYDLSGTPQWRAPKIWTAWCSLSCTDIAHYSGSCHFHLRIKRDHRGRG